MSPATVTDRPKKSLYTVCTVTESPGFIASSFLTVASITGGRLTEGAVYVINADGNDSAVPFRVSARDSAVVLCGLNRYSVSLNLETAIRKQISVYGVSDASDYLETAINLIANKAVDLGAIRCNSQDVSAVEEVLDKYRSGGDYDFCEANILNLV